MKKESFPSKRNYKPATHAIKSTQKTYQSKTEHHLPNISRASFVNWLKELPAEERYLALRIPAPRITEEFLEISRRQQLLGKVDNPECKKVPIQKSQVLANAIQSFMESLTLISHNQFLDSIGFDFGFVGCPQKIYETLSAIISCQTPTKVSEEGQKQAEIDQLTQWIFKSVCLITEKIKQKISEEWDSKEEIRRQKIEKKQFGNFWNNMKQEEKRTFLYAGCVKMPDLHSLIENKCNHQIDTFDLRHQIDELLTTDSKSICNKLFKWRVKKGNALMCSYYEILYQQWKLKNKGVKKSHPHQRERQRKPKVMKEKKNSYTKQKLQRQNVEKMEKQEKIQKKPSRRRRNKKKKQKSEDASSNETNQTEVNQSKEAKEEVISLDIVQEKMEDDLEECTNKISQQANKWHQARVKAYKRVTSIFYNCGVETKLFGSCACGLAIGCSDVDIALSENILDFFPHLDTKKEKMKAAFELFATILQGYAWVTNLKVISTAAIPIIKFNIDTAIEVEGPSFTEKLQEQLNYKIENETSVHIDLTIEIKQQERSQHLGVISTETMKKWISDYPYLIQNTLLLKYQLAKKSLNQTYTGGINTYSLVVLIVAFFKYSSLPPDSMNSLILDKLLKFYGWQFDEKTYGVDILNKDIFFSKQKRLPKQNFQKADLQVMDPLCPEKNMTRNCYKFSQIRFLFREIHKNCFIKARNQFATFMEKNSDLSEKQKADRCSYRKYFQLSKNLIQGHIFSQE